jgi:hypothetical protein
MAAWCLLSSSWIILCRTPDCLTAPPVLSILLEYSRSFRTPVVRSRMLADTDWFVLLLMIVLLWLAWPHQPSLPHHANVTARVQRLLKPPTPGECPICQQQPALPTTTGAPRPPIISWRERKSRRGRPKRITTQRFACPTRRCAYFRITDQQIHALVGDGGHGRCERIQTLRCQACGTTFSTRRGYPLGDTTLSSENRIPAGC